VIIISINNPRKSVLSDKKKLQAVFMACNTALFHNTICSKRVFVLLREIAQ